MKSARASAIQPNSPSIDFQPASLDIWDKKYRLKTKQGEPLDGTIEQTYERVARALADVESDAGLREHWYGEFPYPVGPRGHICHSR